MVFSSEMDLRHHERQVHGGTSTGSTKINVETFFQHSNRRGLEGDHIDQNGPPPDDGDFNFGLDGRAFVPEQPAPSTTIAAAGATHRRHHNERGSGRLTLHPLHVQRTAELRERAAAVRSTMAAAAAASGGHNHNQGVAGRSEAFPTLQETASAAATATDQQQQFRVGWTSDNNTARRIGKSRQTVGTVTEEAFPALGGGGSAATSSGKATNRNKKASAALAKITATPASLPTRKTPSTSQQQQQQRQFAAMASTANTTAVSTAYPALSSATTQTAASATMKTNNRANLSSDNFPSLGGAGGGGSTRGKTPGGGHVYQAATNYAKKHAAATATNIGASNNQAFPSLGSAASTAGSMNSKKKPAPAKAAPPPSLASEADFPVPSLAAAAASNASNSKKTSVREKMLQPKAARSNHTDPAFNANVLQLPTPATNHVTVEDMKASLGPAKYKKLRNYAKQFSSDDISPAAFVDYSASLFDQGYADADFWSFIPSLLESFPTENQQNVDLASQYMMSLKTPTQPSSHPQQQLRNTTAPAPSVSSWSTSSPSTTSVATALQQTNYTAGSRQQQSFPTVAATRTVTPPVPQQPYGQPKKKAAWGSKSSTAAAMTSVRSTNAKKGSVLASGQATAAQTTGGTATKFMAKQSKQQNQPQQQNQKKKKQKDDLRKLAFGS